MANEILRRAKKRIDIAGTGVENVARAPKVGATDITKIATVETSVHPKYHIPFHNKIGIGMGTASLVLSGTGLYLSQKKTKGDVKRERLEEQSLQALKKIHEALATSPDLALK